MSPATKHKLERVRLHARATRSALNSIPEEEHREVVERFCAELYRIERYATKWITKQSRQEN